jgi:hypothetical protein
MGYNESYSYSLFPNKCHGIVADNLASYSRGPRLKSRLGDRLSWLFVRGFLQRLKANARIVL